MSYTEALAHLRAGRPQAAATLLEAGLKSWPADAQSWFLLGACHHAQDDLAAAALALSRSLALDPARPESHLAFITVLRAAGNVAEALAASKEATSRFPANARLLFAAALCLEEAGKLDTALAHYDAAIHAAPGLDDAQYNKALVLSRLGRHEEAAMVLGRLHANHPGEARFVSARCDALLACGRFGEALDVLGTVPHDDPLSGTRRGVALAALRQFDESRVAFADALARDSQAVHRYLQRVAPGSRPEYMLSPENIYLGRGWAALGQCDWSYWNGFIAEMRKIASEQEVVVEPAVAFMGRLAPLSGRERLAVVRRIATSIECAFPALAPPSMRKHKRIRVAVLSPDFREHLNAYLLMPLFELLDRSRFEIFAYSLAVDDGSQARASVRDAADAFRDLQPLSDSEAALAIRDDDVDILLDVGGHTTEARFAITAQRPARVQVNYLGFSCSLASTRVDYAIVDRIAGGDGDEWTEARVFIPDTHFLYDYRSETPQAPVTRRDYGLPEDAFVYCAFHRAEKISPDVFELWMRILARVPNSVLWFRALTERTAQNLRARAEAYAIAPARLVFAPFEPSTDPRYLSRHRLGDLMLDSLHHNATTTACDALGAGLPLLTLPGSAMAARMGESLVRAAGLPEMVVQDSESYVATAVQLARNRAALREATDRLKSNRKRAPLFDTAGRVRALEAAFEAMYERWARGERPADFAA